MKVLFVTRKFPPSIGGMQLFAFDLYTAISKKQTVKLVKWGGSNKALPIIYPFLFCSSFMQLLRGGFDIIHIQDGLLAPIGLVLARIFNRPYLVVIHGLDITYSSAIYARLVVPSVVRADQVVCISQAAAQECLQRGVDASKVLVLPLAVNDELHQGSFNINIKDELGLDPDSQTLLTVGRLVQRKGVAWFVSNVMSELVKENPKVVYLVVGDGPEKQNIAAAIDKHALNSNVKLLGKLDGDLYQAVYNQADVFVMPNINVPNDIEGFGLVLLEASLCELPTVASDTEGIKDAVTDKQNGILVKTKDARKFKEEITKFLNDSQYAKNFGQNSRAYTLNNYNWDKIADDYSKAYRGLLKSKIK